MITAAPQKSRDRRERVKYVSTLRLKTLDYDA